MQDSRNIDRRAGKAEAVPPAVNLDQTENWRLVERAANGDADAFGELYNIYLDRIYRYVFYQVKDKTTAEDVTEDVFLKSWRAIGSRKGKEHSFLPWLFRIAHNHIIDMYRKGQKEVPLETEGIAENGDYRVALEKKMEQQQLLDAISCLPPNQRQVIILKFIEGLDNREIGRVMNRNQGAIRVLQMRALVSLRKKYQEKYADED
jgi:RNA polymerase sigma-70 factor (ECF subfamily)